MSPPAASSPPAQPVAPAPVAAPRAQAATGAAPQTAAASSLGASRARKAPLISPPVLIALVVLLCMVGVFFLGRWSKSAFPGVSAGERSDRPSLESALEQESAKPVVETPSGDEANAAVKPTLLARPQSLSTADAALLDARNRYTIKAIQYDANERNLALAKEVAAHFAKRSLPVCTPYQRGNSLVVLVGAAANTAELEALQRAVKSMDSPNGGKGDFASAYIAPIDSIVQRTP
ncbi:MAG: hypothetical protein IT453_02665 [Planctomycetes bacterium]|nr:hypothetical protein [Planctomycetota bacterium]